MVVSVSKAASLRNVGAPYWKTMNTQTGLSNFGKSGFTCQWRKFQALCSAAGREISKHTHIIPTNLKGSDHSKRMYDASPPLLGQMAFVKQNGTVTGSLDRAWMHVAGMGGGGVHRLWFLSSQGVGGWRRSQLSPWRNNEARALPISLALIQLRLWFQAS